MYMLCLVYILIRNLFLLPLGLIFPPISLDHVTSFLSVSGFIQDVDETAHLVYNDYWISSYLSCWTGWRKYMVDLEIQTEGAGFL